MPPTYVSSRQERSVRCVCLRPLNPIFTKTFLSARYIPTGCYWKKFAQRGFTNSANQEPCLARFPRASEYRLRVLCSLAHHVIYFGWLMKLLSLIFWFLYNSKKGCGVKRVNPSYRPFF